MIQSLSSAIFLSECYISLKTTLIIESLRRLSYLIIVISYYSTLCFFYIFVFYEYHYYLLLLSSHYSLKRFVAHLFRAIVHFAIVYTRGVRLILIREPRTAYLIASGPG